MTDEIKKIREEVERLRNLHQKKYQRAISEEMRLAECSKRNLCNDLLSFIDSLKKETVNEKLEDFAKRQADEFAEREYEVDSYDRGYLSKGYYWGCKAGAKWQKEQMMVKAVNAEASYTMSVPSICISLPLGVNVGDKVKVIVIKEG